MLYTIKIYYSCNCLFAVSQWAQKTYDTKAWRSIASSSDRISSSLWKLYLNVFKFRRQLESKDLTLLEISLNYLIV